MMSVTQIAISRLHREAEALCHRRNANTSVEVGKCYFSPIDDGIVFHKEHYLLDSQHSEYSSLVARLVYQVDKTDWILQIPDESIEGEWTQYPPLPTSTDLLCLLNEVERDPHGYFW